MFLAGFYMLIWTLPKAPGATNSDGMWHTKGTRVIKGAQMMGKISAFYLCILIYLLSALSKRLLFRDNTGNHRQTPFVASIGRLLAGFSSALFTRVSRLQRAFLFSKHGFLNRIMEYFCY